MTSQSDLKTLAEAPIGAAELLGARLAQRHVVAAIVLAMARRQALDLADVHAFLRTFADGFAQMSATAADPLLAQANSIAAEELAAIEPLIRNLLTIPPGAGRA